MRSTFSLAVLFLTLGLHLTVALAADPACRLENCGRSGPYPTLEDACLSLAKQNKDRLQISEDDAAAACHLSREMQKIYLQDCEAKGCFYMGPESYVLPLVGPQLDQAATFSIGDYPRAFLIALHSGAGWYVMGEFVKLYNPSAGGASDGLEVKAPKKLQLIPGPQEEIRLDFEYLYRDIDQGLNRVSEGSAAYSVLCGVTRDKNQLFCTVPIPRSLAENRFVLFPEQEKEICGPKSASCDKPYKYSLDTALTYSPGSGTLSVRIKKGSTDKFADNIKTTLGAIQGTHLLEDLPRL